MVSLTLNHLSLPLAVLALCTSGFVHATADDANQPIHIEGDAAEIDQSQETIVYTGSVQVVQGTLRVSGDRMVVKIKNDQVERITTMGSPARYRQQLDGDQGEVRAHADAILYDTGGERVYLNGSASLTQKGNLLEGESIRYDIVKGKVDASAAEGKARVRMQFDPKDPP